MDSEDEREEKRDDDPDDNFASRFNSRSSLELRRFERAEARVHVRYSSPGYPEQVAHYRVRRFFATMEGFHTGSLDLSGRHEKRYQSLRERWNKFVSEAPQGVADGRSHPGLSTDDREFVIQAYLTAWRLNGALYREELASLISEASRIMALHPKPKFQSLLLLHLPPEILHIILDDEMGNYKVARLFSATCRYLRTIAHPYIFKKRTLELMSLKDWCKFDTVKDSSIPSYLDETLDRVRKSFMEHMEILQRPDVRRYVLGLSISNQCDGSIYGYPNINDNPERTQGFFAPIYEVASKALPHLTSLRTLNLFSWEISLDGLNRIARLPHLHTLILSNCISSVRSPTSVQLPKIPSIRNLHFRFSEEAQVDSWIFLAMCPKVENLSVTTPRRTDTWHTSFAFPNFGVAYVYPFWTLRKWLISCVHSEFIEVVSFWILDRIHLLPGGRLPLTHLKIRIEDSISSDMISELLHALGHTSLKSLVLIGIHYAEPELLDRIAHTLPDLSELTLFYRKSLIFEDDAEGDGLNELINWPQPALDYVSHFASFKALQYFSWNNKHPGFNFLPLSMSLFEAGGFPFLSTDEEDYCDEGQVVAKAIWAQCPSLEHMAYESRLPEYFYRRVKDDGTVSFKDLVDFRDWQFVRQRNPSWGWK